MISWNDLGSATPVTARGVLLSRVSRFSKANSSVFVAHEYSVIFGKVNQVSKRAALKWGKLGISVSRWQVVNGDGRMLWSRKYYSICRKSLSIARFEERTPEDTVNCIRKLESVLRQWSVELWFAWDELWVTENSWELKFSKKVRLTSGDAWNSDTVRRTDRCGGILSWSDTLTSAYSSRVV